MQNNITVTFLGTNGWYDTDTGNTLCILIETENEYVVLDAGNGIYKLDQYVKAPKPVCLFLSHFHLDHVIGLHILAKFNFPQGLYICYRKGAGKLLRFILSRNFTAPPKDLRFPVKFIEVGEKTKGIKFLEAAALLRHPVPCLGFRFNFGGKIIAFVPDTGTCANALKLAQGADLLIAECAMKVGGGDVKWPHLNPQTAAEIATKSQAKRLVLVHFDAEVYPQLEDRQEAENEAKKIFSHAKAAQDGEQVVL